MLRHRRWALVALVLLVGGLAPAVRAQIIPNPPPIETPVGTIALAGAGLSSGNVSYVATIPIDMPGVGARLVEVDGQRRLYVSGIPGLSIYDVTRPQLPLLMSHLPLPNWENEDVSVSADGGTVLVTEYTGTFYLHVIDTSVPQLPMLAATVLLESGGHTSECMDPACDWVYGSEGQIIDLRDRRHPVVQPVEWTELLGLEDGHAINVDDAGIATIDTTPLSMVDASDPLHPRLLASAPEGLQSATGTAYQHNNLRPHADEYRPYQAPELPLAPGELLMGNGETNLTGTCNGGSGPFATWSVRGFDQGRPLEVLDVYRPFNGNWLDGNPALNALGCSGHWFSVVDDYENGGYLVAAAWYEHGTRFLHVDPATGAIEEVGFWQPIYGSASAAHWVGDGYAYVVDYGRGLDIIRFDPGASPATAREVEESWRSAPALMNPLAEAERAWCRIFATG